MGIYVCDVTTVKNITIYVKKYIQIFVDTDSISAKSIW